MSDLICECKLYIHILYKVFTFIDKSLLEFNDCGIYLQGIEKVLIKYIWKVFFPREFFPFNLYVHP